MKNLAIIITTIFLFGSLTVDAQMHMDQNKQKDQQQNMMMQNMMGQGMMQGSMCPMCGQMMKQKMPMKKFMMMVNMLPNMQQKLSLTDEQVNKMIDLQAEFKKQQIDYKANLRKKQMQMEKMLMDMPPADDVKKQMKQCADIKINMKVAAYETVKKMKALLTDEQKENLKNTMMNMGGMMQGGMMNQDHENDQGHEEHH